jgi:hypothetical protein
LQLQSDKEEIISLTKTINYAFSFNVYYWGYNIYTLCMWPNLYDKLGS